MILKALYRTLRTGVALVTGIVSLATASAQMGQAPRTITTAVNNADRVPVSEGLRRNIASARDLGAANPSLAARHVFLVLGRERGSPGVP